MKHLKFLLVTVLILLPLMVVFSDAKGDAAFEKYKESVVNSYKYLNDFVSSSTESETINKVIEAQGVINAAEAMVAELKSAMPEGFSSFENSNANAKAMQFNMKMSYIKGYIEKGREKTENLKNSMLGTIKTYVGWMEGDSSMTNAAPRLDKIKRYFSILDVIGKNDAKIAAAKKDYMSRAEAAYAKSMGQIADMRMPADKYSGKDKAELIALFSDLYLKRTKTKPERIVIINSDWIEQIEYLIQNNTIIPQKQNYLTAQIAIKADKEAMVYEISFRKLRTSNGFGPVELYAIGLSYPILTANINK